MQLLEYINRLLTLYYKVLFVLLYSIVKKAIIMGFQFTINIRL